MAGSAVLYLLGAVLVVVGVAGTVLPALPGPILVFAGLLLAAWADGFAHVQAPALVILGLLTAACYAVDLAATALGAKRVGASPRAMLGAALGSLAGLFFGLPGFVLGPFVGAVLGEYTVQRNLGRAGRAGVGAWIGIALGAAAKLGLVFAMLGVFAAAWWL
jgi:hypothetical protein